MSRRWVSSCCRNTSESDKFLFCSVIWALKASMPPYLTEYRGGFPPSRMSGRCVNASSSHQITCAMRSRTDQAPATPASINSESERPAYDSLKSTHALSSRFRSCDLSMVHLLLVRLQARRLRLLRRRAAPPKESRASIYFATPSCVCAPRPKTAHIPRSQFRAAAAPPSANHPRLQEERQWRRWKPRTF